MEAGNFVNAISEDYSDSSSPEREFETAHIASVDSIEDNRPSCSGINQRRQYDDDESNEEEEPDTLITTCKGPIKTGAYVRVLKNPFKGYYAVIIDQVADDLEIQYFEKQFGKWILDSRTLKTWILIPGQQMNRKKWLPKWLISVYIKLAKFTEICK